MKQKNQIFYRFRIITFVFIIALTFFTNCNFTSFEKEKVPHSKSDSLVVQTILDSNDLKWDDNYVTWNSDGRIEHLDLSGQEIHILLPIIEKIEFLQVLQLSNNKLTELPIEITKLKNLKELDISENDIHYLLSEQLEWFQQIVIHLNNNPFLVVFDEIERFIKMDPLSPNSGIITNSTWCSLPATIRKEENALKWAKSLHPDLIDISCKHNSIDADVIQELLVINGLNREDLVLNWHSKEQDKLIVSWHNEVDAIRFSSTSNKTLFPLNIPPTLANLTSLKKISLDRVNIQEIPKSILKSNSIYALSITNSQIEHIPQKITLMQQLQWLDFTNSTIPCPLPNYLEKSNIQKWAPKIGDDIFINSCS